MQRNFKLGLSLEWITLIQCRSCNKLQSGKALLKAHSGQFYQELCSHIGGADSRLTKATEAKSADFSAIAHVLQLMICAKKKVGGRGKLHFFTIFQDRILVPSFKVI